MAFTTNKSLLSFAQILTVLATVYAGYQLFNSFDDSFFAVVITFLTGLLFMLPVNAFVHFSCFQQKDRINALSKTTRGLSINKLAKTLTKLYVYPFLSEKIKTFTKNKITLQLQNEARIVITNKNKTIFIIIKDNLTNDDIITYQIHRNFEKNPKIEINSNYDLVNDLRCKQILDEATYKIQHLINKKSIPEFKSHNSSEKGISTPHVISTLKPLCKSIVENKNNTKIKNELNKIQDSLEDLHILVQKDEQKTQINSLMDYFLPRLKVMLENYNRMIQVKRQDLVKDQIENTEKSIVELQKLLDEYIRKIFLGEYINEDIDVNTMKEIAQKLDQIKIPQYN